MTKLTLIGICTVAATLGIVGGLMVHETTKETVFQTSDTAKIAALQDKVAQLSERLNNNEDVPSSHFSVQVQATPFTEISSNSHKETIQSDDNSEKKISATPMDAEAGHKRYINKLEQSFYDQDQDYVWSAQASDTITHFFDSQSVQWDKTHSELNSLECGAKLCKMEVVHGDQAAADEFALEFPQSVAVDMPEISYDYETLSNGKISVVMYLTRQVN